jgi:N6-adenosine-specific RNA methylase IME4
MKKPKRVKAKAKRTGPSRRTAAERRAIDKRADADTRAKRKAARKASRKAKKAEAKKPKLLPIAGVLAPMVAATAGHKGKRSLVLDGAAPHRSPGVPTIAIGKIKVGKRHRKDFSHVPGIVASINARGGLIQPISLRPDFTLIAGESRIKAWQKSRFAGQPIPYHILDVDSIIAGEWDENATRKDFTHSEAVAIKRDVEKEFAKLQAARAKSEKAAPGRKASGKLSGRGADRVARFTGIKRESLRKAEAIVDAAAADPQAHGDLLDQMDRTGKVNPAHKKLQVRQARAAIEASPPPMPMNAKQCATWVIDFPWAGEPERDQAALDAADRAFRPYPEMSIKTCCAFASKQIAPNLPDDVAVWLLVTNFILVRGYHQHVYGALGFKIDNASTMLTWGKDKIGRGKILRDQTEHAILLTRGKVTIDSTGANPPSTLLLAPRRENSRKPDEFWRLVERVTPAKRYASIFSQGGEGENWDSHGDQVGKFAPTVAPNEVPARQTEGTAPIDAAPAAAKVVDASEYAILEALAAGQPVDYPIDDLRTRKLVTGKTARLTKLGLERLAILRADRDEQGAKRGDAPAPHQVDIEEAIAAKGAADDGLAELERLGLRRKSEAAAA